MPSFQKLAKHLVTEISLTQLQVILRRPPREGPIAVSGFGCGGHCSGEAGAWCGFDCRAAGITPGVIDREGRLRLTAKDVTDIRKNFPKLRQAVARQVEAHLDKLR